MPEIHGEFAYPGIEGPMSLSYTCLHGITPGTILIRCHPQDIRKLQQTGPVIIQDGVNRIVLNDCRLNTVRSQMSGSGFEWVLELSDRRWKWQYGIIEGWYNQPDPRGKYVPWSLRSPFEMAELCFAAMGEANYNIDLPFALSKADGEDYQRFLRAGELFPQTSTNPPVAWQPETPFNALAKLCDFFGRRIVYDPLTDFVLIVKAGQGASLPTNYSIAVAGPSLSSPQTPDGLMVIGSPTKYQARFKLIPVGMEWNGDFVPINQLSYTPTWTAQTQLNTLRLELPPDADRTNLALKIVLTITAPRKPPTVITSNWVVAVGATAAEQTTLFEVDLVRNGMLANYNIRRPADGSIEIEGKTPETDTFAFTLVQFYRTVDGAPPIPPSAKFFPTSRPSRIAGRSWDYCLDRDFAEAVATDRLTRTDARKLARQYIWQTFRITNIDPSDSTKRVTIPGYGQIERANQIVPLATKVDQIQPGQELNVTIDPFGDLFFLSLYNGLSRDMPATLIGSVSIEEAFQAQYRFLIGFDGVNTSFAQVLPITPSIDPNFLIVSTGVKLFFKAVNRILDPALVLETGCNVRNFKTNALECFKAVRLLANGVPTGTSYKVYRHPDVQLNVTATYTDVHIIQNVSILEPDAQQRAEYYLDAHSTEFVLTDGQVIEYNGIVPIGLDGAVNQVTWEVDGNGCRTKAARNTLPPWFPSYPERRRAENLDALGKGDPLEIGRKLHRQSMGEGDPFGNDA